MVSLRRSTSVLWVAAIALAMVAACTRSAPPPPLDIRLVEDSANPGASSIEVSGATRATLQEFRGLDSVSPKWAAMFRVYVANTEGTPASLVPVAGKYTVAGDRLRFTPLFPFDRGRRYQVMLCNAGSQEDPQRDCLEHIVAVPAGPAAAPTRVTDVFPSADVWPENQLRLYIHFSAPMGRRGGLEHIKLLDDRGREVEDPFLPLDAEFWNADHTRYTVFFDPGRQKRGILPNREMGPSLVAGKTYTFVVDRAWIDGNGNPLSETFTRRFSVGPPDLSPLDTATWRITPPPAGTRDPLTVIFPESLDHGLLLRAVGVKRDGQSVVGDVRIDERETRWRLIPAETWKPGRYELIVLDVLEDAAGNRIGRAFEIQSFERVDKGAEPDVTSIPFTLASNGH